ncbi:MAG: DUF1704 domain-containing protein, partial [Polyangiaceae bacterium]|nr:DUF1704 domain-containing protein [Polyangiaceae bacterium]
SDTVSALEAHDAPVAQSIRIAARAHRGGGLGREAGYIPAFVALRAAVSRDAALEAAVGSGRFSVAAAEVLLRLGAISSRA